MTPVVDSLTAFVECAKSFLRDEVKIPITDDDAKYLIAYHFDSFSTAYMRHRAEPTEGTRMMLANVIKTACALRVVNREK